jgi:hypothetical protein
VIQLAAARRRPSGCAGENGLTVIDGGDSLAEDVTPELAAAQHSTPN